MRTKLIASAVLSLAVILAFIGTVQATGDRGRTIEVLSRPTAISNFVDLGDPGPTPGDMLVFVEELFSRAHPSEKVGELEGRCTLINPATERFECTAVSTFARGTIATQGILINVQGAVSVGGVTGGTGKYRGARGEIRIQLGPAEGPHEIRFILHP